MTDALVLTLTLPLPWLSPYPYLTPQMTDALVLAKRHEFDVFNALDILDNSTFLKVRNRRSPHVTVHDLPGSVRNRIGHPRQLHPP